MLLLLLLLLHFHAQVHVLASLVSHHNIRVVKFSPFESDQLMTAGTNSIRTYRIKDGSQIRGVSVNLQVGHSSDDIARFEAGS